MSASESEVQAAAWRARYVELERQLRDTVELSEQVEGILRRFVLRLALAARGLGDKLDQVLDRTAEAMRRSPAAAELEPLLAELSNAVAGTDTPVVAAARQAVAPALGSELRPALASILDRVQGDPILAERVGEVRTRLGNASAVDDVAAVCNDIADLLSAQRERAKLEHADVQRILLQVDTRLHEFVAYLRGEAAERQAADDSRQQLDAQMLGEVRELTQSVQDATQLETLQSQVRQRLEAMDEHLHRFRSREAERVRDYRERAERMRDRVEQLESETRQLQASLAREQANATTDPLTGIPNRLAYNQRVALEFKRWKRFGRPLCVAAIDIDLFKKVNDTYGHSAGDQAIRHVARTLAGSLRETDFVARYGGEEFIVLLVDTGIEQAVLVLDKLRRAVEGGGVTTAGKVIRVTVSAGVAEFAGDDEPDRAFDRADSALYRAKQGGRNRCERA